MTDITYLDLCKAFGTAPHYIPASKMERRGFDVWTIWWIRNWLDGHTQKVPLSDSMSGWRSAMSGVLLGPVWRTVLLNIFVGAMDSGIE